LASLLLGSFLVGATERGIALRARARQDGPRIAFLIANQGYDVGPLTYPFQDVGLLEPALDSAKFSIIRVFRDVRTRADFERVSTELRKVLKKHPGAVVFFYYSGHAIQIQKANYLVPTGATQWQDIEGAMAGSYKLQNFLNVMGEYSARLQLVFLDSCRNNPFLDRIPAIDRAKAPPGLASERFTRPARRQQACGSAGGIAVCQMDLRSVVVLG